MTRRLRRSVWAAVATCAAVLATGGAAHAGPTPDVIKTGSGAVRGSAGTYLAIPYAAAPVGDLRWKAPQSAPAWSGVRDGTRPPAACPQPKVETISEDCLYLNVYTPSRGGKRKPVIVWLHGGANTSGHSTQYPADTLADRTGSVVVTVNYRLGPLGFLTLPGLQAENAALNHGIQDQQAALRWVRRNIGAFGGDRTRVTLSGESAGSIDTCINMVSPSAAGLMHRAILQSGPCSQATQNGTMEQATARSQTYATGLGCPAGPEQIACLRGKSVSELLSIQPPPGTLPVWTPVIDGRIIPAHPQALIESGRLPRIPVMVGHTRDEGRFITALQYQSVGDTLTEDEYRQLLTAAVGPQAALLLGQVYSSTRYGSPEKALAALFTDNLFACPNIRTARALSTKTRTFAYRFSDPNPPVWDLVPPNSVDLGAYHGSELPFLFDITTTPPFTTAQSALSEQMMHYWGNFAATGNPNIGVRSPLWPRFDSTTPWRDLKPGANETLPFDALRNEHNCGVWDALGS
ncbi:carboxylesterase/lipase family protein [Thermomonospora umbrina]|uniref:Carboxylic ester hydrolase n=1 Tax=Thermomonospora umbrina TaxID=111806 RepID=A0A3D9SPR3_9ACTN|nr:carboxylesterase family protein [Thermomonospora umbrina]REE95953.1 para-nitrobenzyl esterase [Thermomonospora umbrina]